MSKKILVTLFIFTVCTCVFLFIYAQPVSVNTRLNGTAYTNDEEIESDIRISFTGDIYNDLFKPDKFVGTVKITFKNFPATVENVSFRFSKKGTTQYTLYSDGKEFGVMHVSKNFENLYITITDAKLSNGELIYLSAPATDIAQAKEIVRSLS